MTKKSIPYRSIFGALLVSFLSATSAFASVTFADDSEICLARNKPLEDIIAGCDRMLMQESLSSAEQSLVYAMRGQAYGRANRDDEALADLMKSGTLGFSPGSVRWTAKSRSPAVMPNNFLYGTARPLLYMAVIYKKRGDYESMFAVINKQIEIEPSATNYNERCWARAELNRELEIALTDCDKALAIDKNDSHAQDSRAFVAFRLGKYDEALKMYRSAVTLRPRQMDSLFMRGVTRRRLGDTAGGDSDIEQAKKTAPSIAEYYAKLGVEP